MGWILLVLANIVSQLGGITAAILAIGFIVYPLKSKSVSCYLGALTCLVLTNFIAAGLGVWWQHHLPFSFPTAEPQKQKQTE